jgi:hypothetical protein
LSDQVKEGEEDSACNAHGRNAYKNAGSLVPKLCFLDNLKNTGGLGGPLNDFSACCLKIIMHCAIVTKNENKEVGTIIYSTSILALLLYLFMYFVLSLFNNFL